MIVKEEIMGKKTLIVSLIAGIISAFIIFMGSNPNALPAKVLGILEKPQEPKQLYHVYLGGKSLGLIESKADLEKYIDEKQGTIKQKYNVNKVYIPNGLDIIQEITYNDKTYTTEEIYQMIQEQEGGSSFTIDGYQIKIAGYEKSTEDGGTAIDEDKIIYVLDREIFTNSIEKTIKSFIPEEEYDNFLNETQKEIEGTGKLVEDLYIKNNITITKTRIPADAKIYLTEEELCKYLLFGTTEEQATYTVQAGDTITDIAFNNKLSPDEFLIANTSYKTSQDLLYPGQVVTLGIIQPQFDTVEETHVVSKKVKARETVYQDDNTKYAGEETTIQEGSDGESLVTEKIQLINGEITSTVPVSEEITIQPVNKIIARGTKQKHIGGSISSGVEVPVGIGSWVWPTNAPYTVTSEFSYRWGKLHKAIDITSTGYGSPIKAANNGVVTTSAYNGTNGNYIVIKHANGYFTEYAHLAERYVKQGDIVYANDVIGSMGRTGFAQGVHLHFGLWSGPAYTGTPLNPRSLYR